jgi:hypothetical protein
VTGALAAVVALAPVVGAAPESDGVGTGLVESLGVGVEDGDGDGDGDPTGGLPLAVGPGLGLGPQLGDDCEDGPGEPDGAAEVPLEDGEGTVAEGLPNVCPPLLCPPPPLFWVSCCAELMLPDWRAGAKV